MFVIIETMLSFGEVLLWLLTKYSRVSHRTVLRQSTVLNLFLSTYFSIVKMQTFPVDLIQMTDAAIDNILKELCNDPTLDSIANGVYSSNHDSPINRPNPDLSRNLLHDDGSGQLEFSHDFSGSQFYNLI